MIEICNLRVEKPRFEYDFRVDRSSILGNPFYMEDESRRAWVCKRYAWHFYKQVVINEAFHSELLRILNAYKKYGIVRLFCWCAPKQCHAETIKEWLEREAKQ